MFCSFRTTEPLGHKFINADLNKYNIVSRIEVARFNGKIVRKVLYFLAFLWRFYKE